MTETHNRQKILVVDDEERNLRLLSAILNNYGYVIETAKNGLEALEKTRVFLPDLVLLDIMMPGMDGYETCAGLKNDPLTGHIPVVMVTALEDRESRLRGLESGANDFLAKPIDSTELMVRLRNLLKVKKFEDLLKHHNERLESEVKHRTGELLTALGDLSESNKKLNQSQAKIKEGYVDTIQRLTIVAEFKDEDTASHIKRISFFCRLVAKNLGWSGEEQEVIFHASPMHDIGKVGIPSDIILKPGRLNAEEFALMKTHAVIGCRILQGSASEFLQMASKIAISHHERWDGGGYPAGLRGEDIPLEGRIMNIADQYDALRSRRSYKPPFDHEKTFRILTEGDGRTMPSNFDPLILQVFKDTHKQFEEIYKMNGD